MTYMLVDLTRNPELWACGFIRSSGARHALRTNINFEECCRVMAEVTNCRGTGPVSVVSDGNSDAFTIAKQRLKASIHL